MNKWLQLGSNAISITFKGITTGAEAKIDINITTI